MTLNCLLVDAEMENEQLGTDENCLPVLSQQVGHQSSRHLIQPPRTLPFFSLLAALSDTDVVHHAQ